MKNNNSDFISLTAAVRRAKSEGLNLSYAGLRRFVAEGFIPHVPNGSHNLVKNPKKRPRVTLYIAERVLSKLFD